MVAEKTKEEDAATSRNGAKDEYALFSPVDFRYSVPQLVPYLSEESFVRYKAKVEAALARELAKRGICSQKAAEEIEDACSKVCAEEVYEEEARIKHDIRALVNVIRAKVSDEAKPYVHLTATSYDIVDTANALRFKHSLHRVVVPDLIKLERALIKLALRHSRLVQVGRTHGQHAEPITFGFYLSFYVSRLGQRILRLYKATQNLVGKFSGAVGVYGPLSLVLSDKEQVEEFERDLLESLGLCASEVSTQIVEPEATADLFHAVTSTFGVIANFSRDMRHLQRTEIDEISEEFSEKQVGSSTMPQKRNPVSFENIEGLWKRYVPQMVTVYMDQISEHQRDLTNSSSQRYLPELIVAFDYAVRRLSRALWNDSRNEPRLAVNAENMKRNLDHSLDRMAAEPLYVLLALSTHPDAHEHVRQVVQRSIAEGSSFLEALKREPKLQALFEGIREDKRKFVEHPELYVGVAAEKAERIARHWESEMSKLEASIESST